MKTVIEMARSVGATAYTNRHYPDRPTHTFNVDQLERLVELVRADQDEKYKWDVHSCGPTCTKAACVAVREAVQAEREACAKVVDEFVGCESVAYKIRARSNT
jgi:predicted amidohydrolase YtcJ